MSLDPVRTGVDVPERRGCLAALLFTFIFYPAHDRPIHATAVAVSLLLLVTADGPLGYSLLAVAVVGFAVLIYFTRRWTFEHRTKTRFARAWRGVGGETGLAFDLGLVNPSKAVPKVKGYGFGDGYRTVTFGLPAGLTADHFAKVSKEIADSLGGHRAQVTAPAPRRVEVRVMDTDTLSDARSADWSRNVQTDEATPRLPEADEADGRPFWEADE